MILDDRLALSDYGTDILWHGHPFNGAITLGDYDGVMAIGSDYPTPVVVNGFSCKNCTDVGYAKKHIDPAHPKSGPYGINAKDDPTVKNASPAVLFGGNLRTLLGKEPAQGAAELAAAPGAATSKDAVGGQLNISA